MKSILITLLAITSTFLGLAQDQNADESIFGFLQDEIFVEGNIQFSSVNNQNTENVNNLLRFNPKVGYFLSNNLALGVQVAYGFEKTEVLELS